MRAEEGKVNQKSQIPVQNEMPRLVAVRNPVYKSNNIKHPKVSEDDDPDDKQAEENRKPLSKN